MNNSHNFSQDNVQQQQQLNVATVHFPSIIHHSVNTVLSEYSFFFFWSTLFEYSFISLSFRDIQQLNVATVQFLSPIIHNSLNTIQYSLNTVNFFEAHTLYIQFQSLL